MSFELRIGELVVDGLPADRGGLHVAVERELARLARERGVPAAARRGGALPRIDAGSIPAASATLGSDLARAVWEALER